MLNTLIRLGEGLSQNRGEWDDIIDLPNIERERERNLNLYVAELVFDLDSETIFINSDLEEYDESLCFTYKNIKIQGGNNKAIYCCVETGKTEQIRKTFFGTVDGRGNFPIQGQLQEAINKDFPELSKSILANLLPEIFRLRELFENRFTVEKDKKGRTEKVIDENLLFEKFNLGNNSKVILIFSSVIASSFGIENVTPISQLEGYEALIRRKFLGKNKKVSTNGGSKKICYATGQLSENVSEVDFLDRYSLNKMFVKETKNYASGFDKNNFRNNYQVGIENQLLLSRASKYLLEHQKVRIAGIDHCIIPQFLTHSKIDIKYVLKGILKKTELLFQSAVVEKLTTNIEYEIDEPYWITFLAFESDGNFFKSISEIKDVSKVHLIKLIDTAESIDGFFRSELEYAVDWQSVMMNYGQPQRFSLNSIYSIVPLRKDKEKKNDVLSIFKMIFENRKIESIKIYKHFCDLILCHRYNQYSAFKNIREQENFDFAIRDSVFKYFAFITFLKQINLLNAMEENEDNLSAGEEIPVDYGKRIELFFKQMNYHLDQKAMFHLGRMVNSVAYLQRDKNKTVLEKVNFSGMDRSDIIRLRNSLIEKAQQYNRIEKVLFSDANFSECFNYNAWRMKPEEAVFFMLSGYSFGLIKNQNNP